MPSARNGSISGSKRTVWPERQKFLPVHGDTSCTCLSLTSGRELFCGMGNLRMPYRQVLEVPL